MNGFVRTFIVPVLVGALIMPPTAFADNTAPVPVSEAHGPYFQALGSNDDAKTFAENLLRSIPADDEKTLDLFHVEGEKPDPRLTMVLAILANAGVKVNGTLVTRKRFEQVISAYNEGGVLGEGAQQFLLSYEQQLPAAERKSVIDFLKPKNLFKGLSNLKMKLFGLPYGITVFTHFVKKNKEGNWVRRFARDWKTTAFAMGTSVWAIGNITLIRMFAPGIFHTAPQPLDTEFWVINAIVFTWVFLCLNFQREVASFRSQGKALKVDPKAPEGQQITMKQNESFFTAACLGQEWTLNGILNGLMMGTGTVPATMGVVGNAAMNGALSAYAYIAPEDIKGKWLAESEAIQKQDPKRAAQLNTRAIILATVFWNVVFPTFKNLNFFIPGALAALPFFILGTLGFGWKQTKEFQRKKAAQHELDARASDPGNSPEYQLPRGCSDFLVIASKKAS